MSSFDSNGNYNKTNWKTGDKITADKLNKIEESLEIINNNDIERHKEADERLDVLEEQNEAVEERFDELEDLVEDNKSEVEADLEGLHAKDKELASQLEQIENDIPYVKYDRNKKVDLEGEYKHHQGFSNHSKKTFGRYEDATVMSVIANIDNPKPQVLGTDTKGLATYTNRDSVALYTENTGSTPILTILTGMTYTDNSAVVPNDTNMNLIKEGMIIDIGKNVNADWCVGIIKEIHGTELIMEDGFYTVRNDGVTPTKVKPTDGLQARIQMNNKVWVVNSNLFIKPGCSGGTNMELGVLCDHANIDDVGGIDLINMREATHYGVKVRKGVKAGFNTGYISENNGVQFAGISDSSKSVLLQGRNGNEIFNVLINGQLSRNVTNVITITSNTTVGSTGGLFILNGDNINLTLPPANNQAGRIIEVISIGTNNLITAVAGNGISTPTLNQQQISIGKGDYRFRTMRFVSDGGVAWWQLSDSNNR